MSPSFLPLFLRLRGRRVVVVGGGGMAQVRVRQLREVGAEVTVVAPEVRAEIVQPGVTLIRRGFVDEDLEGAWLAVAAATPAVNRAVARAAEARRIFVNAVDDPESASAYAAGVVRRAGVTVAVSTEGKAPALTSLLRDGIEALLPEQLGAWVERAEALRLRWKREAVAMGDRRPLLLRALVDLHRSDEALAAPAAPTPVAAPPLVSIVGAGPGDPGLLTVTAVARLAAADVVLYDALVDPAVLTHARDAHCFLVGKRPGRPSVRQEAIHRMLVRAARRGKRVVRLKCGDPFVFGRGGEEVLALAQVGIPHEVVPGVSSALAAPALAGIPLTHRGVAQSFTVVSGHSEAAYRPVVEALGPAAGTLVVLMGLGTRARLAATLVACGWSPATPAAIILAASSPHATRWIGTVAELGSATMPAGLDDAPGTLVIGAVVDHATVERSAGAWPLAVGLR